MLRSCTRGGHSRHWPRGHAHASLHHGLLLLLRLRHLLLLLLLLRLGSLHRMLLLQQ